jgi:hypothetical protein
MRPCIRSNAALARPALDCHFAAADLSFLLTIAITLIIGGQFLINYMVANGWLKINFTYYLLTYGKWW